MELYWSKSNDSTYLKIFNTKLTSFINKKTNQITYWYIFCIIALATPPPGVLSACPFLWQSDQQRLIHLLHKFRNILCHHNLKKCDLIKEIPYLSMKRKSLIHFYHSFLENPSMSVLEMNDRGVAPLINHSKVMRVMKFIFYLISQHMYQSESAAVICLHISAVSGNVGDL